MRLNHSPNIYVAYFWRNGGVAQRFEMLHLSFDFLNRFDEFDFVLFLKFDFPLHADDYDHYELMSQLELLFAADPDLFVLLTNRRRPPLKMESMDEYIYSFSCGYQNFQKLINECNLTWVEPHSFLFRLLDQMFSGKPSLNKVVVKQLPITEIATGNGNQCDVIIPHKGNNEFLDNLLYFLSHIKELNIYVGLDQDIEEDMTTIRETFFNTHFYSFSPNPVGPYVIRNKLINESSGNLLFFQDSDDIPCADRFTQLSNHILDSGCELCGSHEIKMDYYTQTIRAVRYPSNVTNSLKDGHGHSLLHPASGITRTAFYLCDTLSEERIYGNDTKFLYHSYFSLDDIQNVDEFLYIRRSHPDSLTHAAETSIISPARIALQARLVADFNLVKSGQLQLQSSSLRYVGPSFPFKAMKF
jgi:hypothetical protein